MRVFIFLSLMLAALAASLPAIDDVEDIPDQIAMESDVDESTLPYESSSQVVVVPPVAGSPTPLNVPFANLNEYLRYLIRSELKKTLQSSSILQNPFANQPPVQGVSPYSHRPVAQPPFYWSPYKSQPNFYYPPYYGPYNPFYHQPPYQSPYQPHYSPYAGPVYKSGADRFQIQARRPFPSAADELSDDEALSNLNSLKANQEGVSERFVQPSISVASDYSSVTITFPSIYSVLSSVQAVANQLASSVTVTTKTVIVPGISLG